MTGNIDYSPLFHGLFFMTTILFISFSASLIFHISKLMKKNQKLREIISEKEKELSKAKTNTTFDLQAFANERAKSILISVNKDYTCRISLKWLAPTAFRNFTSRTR